MATNNKSGDVLSFTLRGGRPQMVPVDIDGKACGVSTNTLAVTLAIKRVLTQSRAVQAAMEGDASDLEAEAARLDEASRAMARDVFGDEGLLGGGTVDVVEVTRLIGIARAVMSSPAYQAANGKAE